MSIKSKIKKNVKKVLTKLYKINYKVFMKENILLESSPDYSDNTKAVYDLLIKKGYNERYKIIWFVSNRKKFENVKIKNVKFVLRNGKFKNVIICMYYNIVSKYIIDCNGYIRKYNKNQFRIHLTHGEFLKVPTEYAKGAGEFDYIIKTSKFFNDITCKSYEIESKKIRVMGFPRNDYLYTDNHELFKIYPEIKRKKVILWLPTYRNHMSRMKYHTCSTDSNFPYGVPSLSTEEELKELNSILDRNLVLLLIKLHPAENDSKISSLNLSNIKIIKDTIFEENHTNLYQLLSITDALITDYSSVYYDYLLTNKPIGLAISDIEEYKKHVDLLFDNYEENIAGEYIYNFEDLKKFINNVANGIDEKYNERIAKRDLYHKYKDGKSAERVVALLEEKMKENEKK